MITKGIFWPKELKLKHMVVNPNFCFSSIMIEKVANYYQLHQDKLCAHHINFPEENIKKRN